MHENTIIKYLSDDIRTVKEDVKAMLRIIAGSGVEGGVGMENRGANVVVLEENELRSLLLTATIKNGGSNRVDDICVEFEGSQNQAGSVASNTSKVNTTNITKKRRKKRKTVTKEKVMNNNNNNNNNNEMASISSNYEYFAAAATARSTRTRIMVVSAFILGSVFTTCAQGIRGREADSVLSLEWVVYLSHGARMTREAKML
jgi:hypothetical protein